MRAALAAPPLSVFGFQFSVFGSLGLTSSGHLVARIPSHSVPDVLGASGNPFATLDDNCGRIFHGIRQLAHAIVPMNLQAQALTMLNVRSPRWPVIRLFVALWCIAE